MLLRPPAVSVADEQDLGGIAGEVDGGGVIGAGAEEVGVARLERRFDKLRWVESALLEAQGLLQLMTTGTSMVTPASGDGKSVRQ